MLSKRMKKCAYMEDLNNERGFSIVSMLLVVTLLYLTIPFLAYLLQKSSFEHHYENLSVEHFFLFLRNDVLEAIDYDVQKDTLQLHLPNGKKATISIYKQDVRRQVDGKGHEIYLKDIQQLSFQQLPFGIQATVTTLRGETYEKTIIFYE